MGLIKAVLGSAVGTLSETWKDYFVCNSLDNDTLMVKGVANGGGGSGEIITNGSGIVVADGQCALVVDDGVVVEVAAEAGKFTFDTSTSPSIFDGGLQGIKDTFNDMIGVFTYGGNVNRSQRVYYVNTKEIMGNLFGTATPIPFRVIDNNINLDVEIPIRCNGEYTFKIVNPIVFYKNVAGNKASRFTKDDLGSMMKAEVLSALQPAFAAIAKTGIRYSEVGAHVEELKTAIQETLNPKWSKDRGIEFVNIAINSVSANAEDEQKIRDLQMRAVNKDQSMAAATMAEAVMEAAKNPNGAANGFVGMNFAAGSGVSEMFAAANNNKTAASTTTSDTWTCSCGSVNDGAFCPKCGSPKPTSSYCPNCGKAVPAGSNFCPSCGTKIN